MGLLQKLRFPVVVLGLAVQVVLAGTALAVELPKTDEEKKKLSGREITILRRQMKDREDTAASAFKNAETAFLVGEFDKAIEEFLSVGREFQDTSFRMKSVLRVGDVYYHQKKFDRAVSYYQRSLKIPAELWWPEESVEDYARADYMIGVCYFDQRSMDRAFAHFRRFVQRHPASKLLDRAYDFIGRGNMDMKRYGQAIEAFRMVGTASLGKQARRTVAPGEELYIRVVDADVGMATKHSMIPVRITTTAGDDERLDLKSLGIGSSVFLATIKTRLGSPRLTKSLDDAFSKERRKKIDDTVLASTSMDEEANELDKKLAAMEPPENTPENQEELKKFDAEKARLKERIASLRDGAVRLREQAYGDLSTAFAKVEEILKNWNIQELTLTTEEKKEAERPDQDAEEEGEGDQAAKKQAEEKSETADEGEGVSLSDTFTQQQIDETRREVQKEPTSDKTFKFRRSMLEYWHDQLLQEYKTLDLNGSDTITVEYTDLHGNQKDGEVRKDTLDIASDANILCVGQDMTSPVMAVILGDEVRIKVVDPDMDSTNGPDSVQVMVSSIPKVAKAEEEKLEEGDKTAAENKEKAEEMSSLSVQVFAQEEEEQKMPELFPKDAPNFPTTLKETGEHTGVFTGSFSTLPAKPDAPEAKLGLSPERLVYVAYADKRTATHPGEWAASARLEVVSGSKGEHEVIEMQDTQLDRRSELEKGVAMGKLARVYMDLGLRVDARRVFDEALKVVKAVVDAERGSPLGEEATYQMWDLYFASGDEIAAAEACAKLIATFPNSPLADDALLIMGKAEKKNIHAAMGHFSRLVQQYPDSDLAPEAAYLFADLKSKAGAFDVAAFEQVANKYPDSNFAAQSLLRLSEYYIENKDFARAKDYLERIALDFPDFNSLDKVTYMRGICAYRSGDVQLAYTLMHETIEKYPGTSVANSASKVVELLARKLKQ